MDNVPNLSHTEDSSLPHYQILLWRSEVQFPEKRCVEYKDIPSSGQVRDMELDNLDPQPGDNL